MNFGAALKQEYPEPGDKITVVDTVPVPAPVLTMAAVRGQFAEYLIRVQGMVRDAESLEVTDEDRLKFAVALGGEAAKITKRIDAKRKEVTAEASDFVKSVNGFCKDYTDRLGEVVMITKNKIGVYRHQQELERRKQEEAARKAAQEFQEKLRLEAEEANRKAREEAARKAEEETRVRLAKEAEEEAAKHEIQAPVVTAPVIPVKEKVTRTETGAAAHERKAWKAEVINEAEIPREYLTVDMKKINEAVKMGAREIPGVRIFEETSTVFRS